MAQIAKMEFVDRGAPQAAPAPEPPQAEEPAPQAEEPAPQAEEPKPALVFVEPKKE